MFDWGVENLYQMPFFYDTYKDILPAFLIKATAYYTSYVELFSGALLIIGFRRTPALYTLASVLIIVALGHGLVEPIWDLSHVFYRAALLVALLLLPTNWDTFSFDEYLKRKSNNKKSKIEH